MQRGTNRRREGQRGQALTEMGIIAVLFVFLVMGVIEFGRAWMVANVITHAARDGARAAAVTPPSNRDANGFIADTSSIQERVTEQLRSVTDPGDLNVVVDQPTSGGIALVRVTVNGSIPYLFNLPGVGTSFAVARSMTFRDEGR
jgi:Flp pilus assembly protein TadG